MYDGRRFYPTEAEPRRKTIASLDTEDDSKGGVLRLCLHDGKRPVVFKTPTEAVSFLWNLSLPRPLYVAAHNLEYDLVNLFQGRLEALDWTFFGGRLITARARGTRLVFLDSLNHSYHNPLWRLGEVVGLKKLPSTHPWTRGAPFTKRDERYMVRDAKIVAQYMNAVQELYLDAGAEMKSTTPATAMDLWRRNHLDEAIPGLTRACRGYFRKAYFGGRVEIFRMRSKGKVRYYDANSLYPTVMQGRYPDVLDIRGDGPHGVVCATVEVPACHVPPLPVRLGGKLIFPIGRFRGMWCSCELEYAESLGVRVLKVHGRLGSDSLVRPFASYVRDGYLKRINARTELEKTTWKFALNSLYGKFGTSGTVERLVDPKSIKRKLDGTEFWVGPLLCVSANQEPPVYANVLWAAWTTALARIRLHKALRAVERAGAEPLYCDTDSVIFRENGRQVKLPLGSGLGQWKLEAEITDYEAKAPKVYRFTTKAGETIKAKGVPTECAESFFDGDTAYYDKPLRLREASRRGLVPNVWIQAEKTLKSGYDKRIMLRGGGTSPIVLERS